MPDGFTWIVKPELAALACPMDVSDLLWLRGQGLDVVLTLTEEPLPKSWINEAGLLGVHVPVQDYSAPTMAQFQQAVRTIQSAHRTQMGVAVHCQAGLGRTGTILAAYQVSNGQRAADAIRLIRELRPGSIESAEQEAAIFAWERQHKRSG